MQHTFPTRKSYYLFYKGGNTPVVHSDPFYTLIRIISLGSENISSLRSWIKIQFPFFGKKQDPMYFPQEKSENKLMK